MVRSHLVASFLALVSLNCLLGSASCYADSSTFVPDEYQPNYDDGYQSGYSTGYDLGLDTGKSHGATEGRTNGRKDGYDVGWGETYQPAFDHAYDAQYPDANRAGWDAGVSQGFDAGYKWAPIIYQAWLSQNSSSSNLTIRSNWNGVNLSYGSFSSINISSGGLYVSLVDSDYDWAGHYYDIGYTDGKGVGTTAGDTVGYNLAYPVAYAAGYKVGYVNGTDVGTAQGTDKGSRQGYTDGWGAGHSTGYDLGFDAGIADHLFGKFVRPNYVLNYTPRSTTLSSSATVSVPEPASMVLLAIGAGFLGLVRRHRA